MSEGSLRRKDLPSSVDAQYLRALPHLHLDELYAYLPFFDPLQDPQIGDWVLITPMRRDVLLDPLIAIWEGDGTDKKSSLIPSLPPAGENNQEENHHHHQPSTSFCSSPVSPHRYTLAEYFSVFSSPKDASDTTEGRGRSLPPADGAGGMKEGTKKGSSAMHSSHSTEGYSFSLNEPSSRCVASPPNDTDTFFSRGEYVGTRCSEEKKGEVPLTGGDAFLLSHEGMKGRLAEEEMTDKWRWEETGEETVADEVEPIVHAAWGAVPPARMSPAPSFFGDASLFFAPPSDEGILRNFSDGERTGEECRAGTVEVEVRPDQCDSAAAPSSFSPDLRPSPFCSPVDSSPQRRHFRRTAFRAQRRVTSVRGDPSRLRLNTTEMEMAAHPSSAMHVEVPSFLPRQPSPSSSLRSPLFFLGSPRADLSASSSSSTSTTPLPAPTRGSFGPILAPLSSMLSALTKRKRHHRREGNEGGKLPRQSALLFLHVRLGLLTSTPPIEFGGGTLACRTGGEAERCGGGKKKMGEWNVDKGTPAWDSLRNEVWTLLAPDRPGGYMRRVWVCLQPKATAGVTDFPAAILREADVVRTLPSSFLDPCGRVGIEELPSEEEREKFERLTMDDFRQMWRTQIECVAEGQWQCWASQVKKAWRSTVADVSNGPTPPPPPKNGTKKDPQHHTNTSTEVREERKGVGGGGTTSAQEKVRGTEENLMGKDQKMPAPVAHSFSLVTGEADPSSGAPSIPKGFRNTETKVFISPPFPSTTLYARRDSSNTFSSDRTVFHTNKNT